jgi:hypothetical protein
MAMATIPKIKKKKTLQLTMPRKNSKKNKKMTASAKILNGFGYKQKKRTRRKLFNLQHVLLDNFDWSTMQVLGMIHDSKIWGLLDWSM